MFRLIESSGFTGHYKNGFGSLEDMLEGREYLLERAVEQGIGISIPEQMCSTNYTLKWVSKDLIEFQSALAPISERNCIPLNLMFSISW